MIYVYFAIFLSVVGLAFLVSLLIEALIGPQVLVRDGVKFITGRIFNAAMAAAACTCWAVERVLS